jgi:hypothetical protein
MEHSLSMLRQLRYVENVMFAGKDPYIALDDADSPKPIHSDIEMILLDLL